MASNTSNRPTVDGHDAIHQSGTASGVNMHVNGGSHTSAKVSLEEQSDSLKNLATILKPDKIEPIAVIGLSLRFPQDATSPQNFWKMLLEKRSAMSDVPSNRFNVEAFHEPGEHKPGAVSRLCTTRKLSSQCY